MNSARNRSIYLAIKEKFKEKPGIQISWGFLHVEQTLTNTSGLYSFDVKKIGNENANERKLDRNDTFVVTHWMFYIAKQQTAKPTKQVLQTYPNATAFGATSGFDVTDLETVYSGIYRLKIGSKVNIEAMPASNFRYVPQTQQSASTNHSQSSWKDHAVAAEPLAYLGGDQDISVELSYTTFAGITLASVDTGYTNQLIFRPYGYLVKGLNYKD